MVWKAHSRWEQSSMAQHWTCDWKSQVQSVIECQENLLLQSYRAASLCWLWLQHPFHPWDTIAAHEKKCPSLSARSAGGRLQLNMHTSCTSASMYTEQERKNIQPHWVYPAQLFWVGKISETNYARTCICSSKKISNVTYSHSTHCFLAPFLQTLTSLVTPLKGHSLSTHICLLKCFLPKTSLQKGEGD